MARVRRDNYSSSSSASPKLLIRYAADMNIIYDGSPWRLTGFRTPEAFGEISSRRFPGTLTKLSGVKDNEMTMTRRKSSRGRPAHVYHNTILCLCRKVKYPSKGWWRGEVDGVVIVGNRLGTRTRQLYNTYCVYVYTIVHIYVYVERSTQRL